MNKNISCEFDNMKLHDSLCFLLLVLLAASTTAVPRITPNTADITLSVGTERDLQCEDATSIGWYFAHHRLDEPNALNVIRTQKDGYHIITLDMSTEVSGRYVGYYYCVETALIEESFDADTLQRLYERQQAARIYVYLDFPGVGLAVSENMLTVNAAIGESLTVPCLPTRKDVNVTLEHEEELRSGYAFDPTEGFAMDNIRLHHAGDYICYYTHGDQLVEQMVVVRVSRSVKKPNRPIIHTRTKYIEESGEIRLSCQTKEPNLEFIWELPTTSTAEQELRIRKLKSPMENVLIVSNANLDTDTGEYTCIVTTATMNYSSKESIVITVYPSGKCRIEIKEPSNQHTITVNKRENRVMWGVDYEGHPSPLVADWFDVNNNRLLDNSSKFLISSQELSHGKSHAQFTIYDPVLADMGDYVMRVYHDDECQQNLTFRLIVKEAPIVELHSRTVRADRDVQMSCIVVGYPASKIHWTWTECGLDLPTPSAPWSMETRCRSGLVTDIDEHALTVVRNEKFQNSTLTFRPSGPGQLNCSAKNSIPPDGSTTESAAVYVLDHDEPFVTSVTPDVITVGETAELRCLVEMYNFTENVRWQRHGVDIESTADDRLLVTTSKLKYMHSVVLHFSSISAQDEGSYECVAIGFDGTAVSRTQGVVVNREQRPLFGVLADVQTPLTTLQINERLELSCAPTGMPVPEVKWMRDDVLLQNDEHVTLITEPVDQIQFNHTLVVIKLNQSDAGKYECVAWNRLGEARYIFPVELDSLGPSKTMIGMVIGLLILLLLTTCVGIFLYRREHKKWLLLKHAGISYFDNGDMSNYNPDLSRMEQADLLPYDRKYEFPRDRLRLSGVKLGAGAFGIVYKAQAFGIVPDVAETTVAVKTIKNSDKDEDIKALISELKIMIHMGKHVNVVNLLGAVTRDIRKRSLYVITEFCDLGNLYHFLKKNRNHFVNQVTDVTDVINSDILTIQQQMHEEPDGPPTSTSYFQGSLGQDSDAQLLSVDSMRASRRTTSSYTTANGGQYVPGAFQTITTTDLVCWSFQVARGMAYLAQRGVLHGDLAARNILLCSDKVVKICDFGLSRSLRPEEDYQKESDGPLPIKWLAIESISHKIFNTSTDVWSFGIVMWELFSMAQVPYADVPTEKMLSRLQEGHRMLRPKYATQALYELMRECWSVEPAQRPRFDMLARRLGEMLPSDVEQEFVDMNDQYMQVNIAEGRDKGDYLSVLLLPDDDAPAVPFGGPTLANVENGFADRSPDAEAIPMLTRAGRSMDGGDGDEPRRAMTPLARSDTDTDLDKTWQQQSAMANISPRRLPPQNSYVNLPATSPSSPPPPVPTTAPSDAVSNLGYVMMNNNRT